MLVFIGDVVFVDFPCKIFIVLPVPSGRCRALHVFACVNHRLQIKRSTLVHDKKGYFKLIELALAPAPMEVTKSSITFLKGMDICFTRKISTKYTKFRGCDMFPLNAIKMET